MPGYTKLLHKTERIKGWIEMDKRCENRIMAEKSLFYNFDMAKHTAEQIDLSASEKRKTSGNKNMYICVCDLPRPMAAQQSTVTTDNVTFKLVMECAVRGFRSQHRVNKYNSRPNNDRIKSAAGADPSIPKLCVNENRQKREKRNENDSTL